MAKNKADRPSRSVPTGEGPPLKHSPFAGLATSVPQSPEREVSGAGETAPASERAAQPVFRGRLILRRETKRRGGKAAIVVHGFGPASALSDTALDALAKELKQTLGCGGTLEGIGSERELVLQGDQPARVAELLRARGFKVGGVTS